MLKPELAKEQVEKFKQRDGKECQRARVVELPEAERRIGLALIGYNPNACPFEDDSQEFEKVEERHAAYDEALRTMAEAKPETRANIFAALFPTIAATIEQAWHLFDRLPYQHGWLRKSFRAPGAVNIRRSFWLATLIRDFQPYQEQDIVWLAEWVPYLGHNADDYGYLFAAAIESGTAEGERVFETLLDSARGTHSTGAMGRHVTRAMLVASRPDGWEFIEKMLLAAQRQEGLRQVILESVDEAHPEAFRRMLRLILDHDLVRFSATVRAFDVWYGLQWDVTDARAVREAIAFILTLWDNSIDSDSIAGEPEAQKLHFRLCTLAMQDAYQVLPIAQALLKDTSVERRWVAANLLANLHIPEADAVLLEALEDDDLRVVTIAANALHSALNRFQADVLQGLPSR